MDPWKIIGFEKFQNEEGVECVRLYAFRRLTQLEVGHTGEGFETQRFFYKPKYVKYEPKINEIVAIVDGRYGIGQIISLGMDKTE